MQTSIVSYATVNCHIFFLFLARCEHIVTHCGNTQTAPSWYTECSTNFLSSFSQYNLVSSCVTNCHLGFSLASSVSGCVWVCVCLGLYAILEFLRFLIVVKCEVAGSLIATGV
jgi:hypothetical protein